jgi:glutamyl-tRNA reductase
MSPEDALEVLAHTLTNRLLHAPTVAVRDAASQGDAELARAAERLFPEATPPDAPRPAER